MAAPAPHLLGRVLALWLAASGLALAADPGSDAPEPPAEAKRSKRECAICHIMWLNDFKREDQATLVPYDPFPQEEGGRQDVVSTERMCFSCHDGFVLDSRERWRKGRHDHPVGVAPSSAVELPTPEGKELFPLNEDGKVYCGTCHTPHAVRWDREAGVSRFLRMKNVDSSLCSACHLDKSTGPEEGNHPVLEDLDELPAALAEAGAHFGADDTVSCETCHRVHGAREEKILVLAAETSALCAACHADRTPQDLEEAGRLGTHPINIPPEQAEVPEKLLDQGAKLSPGGELTCQTCHKLHGAVAGPGNLVAANVQSSLCRTCHLEQLPVSRSQHDMRLLDRPSENIRHQSADTTGVCGACHLAHGGTGPKMWARTLDPDVEPMAGLCLSCHRKGGLAGDSRVGGYSHPVGVSLHGAASGLDLPLYTRAGEKAGTGHVTCATCHDPHRPSPTLQARTPPAGSAEGEGRAFLRRENGVDAALCGACHEGQRAVKATEHDMAIMAPGARNAEGQRADQAGLCGACHLVHNARGPHLWARRLAPGADRTTSTCLDCHREGGVADDKAVAGHNHPLDVSLERLGIETERGRWTGHAQGSGEAIALAPLPLYGHDGRRAGRAGRMACATCHDPHRWSPSHGERREDPRHSEGGPQDSFLRLADDGESRLCVNCHVKQRALLESTHDLTHPRPGVRPAAGDGQAPASPCGACHRPHDAGETYLWAREQGPGETPGQRLCADCHRPEGVAEETLIGAHSHPVGVPPDHPPTPKLPLYGEDGERLAEGGKVDCATCHDPHRGEPTPKTAPGGGGAGSGYLRMAAAPSGALCTACHRPQGWVEGTDHDLRITAPRATNAHQEDVRESGVCGACHAVHNAADGPYLSALPPEHGDDGLCLACHAPGRAGEAKVPFVKEHPREVTAWSEDARGRGQGHPAMPVYGEDDRPADIGLVTCATCHDPHRWRSGKDEKGPGRESEGDVLSSFLRLHDTRDFLCADCHGLDALFRYKYFHHEGVHPAESSE